MAADDMAMPACEIWTLTRGNSDGTDGTAWLWTSESGSALVMQTKERRSPSIQPATKGKIVADGKEENDKMGE